MVPLETVPVRPRCFLPRRPPARPLKVSGQRVFLWESPLFFRLRYQEKGRCV